MKVNETISNQVKQILSDHLSVEEFTENSDLYDDLGADSLDMVEISMMICDKFDIDDIPDESMRRIKTVKDLITYVGVKRGTRNKE